jgi:putative hydrolase of the HAD superfamily
MATQATAPDHLGPVFTARRRRSSLGGSSATSGVAVGDSSAVGGVARGKHAVLLDALGTLVELEPPGPRLVRALRRRLDLDVTVEHAERAIAAEIAYYRAHLDEGRDSASLAALRRRCAQVMGHALAAAVGGAELDADSLTAALLESLRFKAYADAAPALAALRRAGVRLVVVSNWDVSLPRVLGRVGLAGCVDAVLTSAGVGARKPAPEIFHAALRAAGVGAAEAIHVGDSLAEDVAGAVAAGVEPVLVARGRAIAGQVPSMLSGPPAGVRTIRTLTELVEGP